MQSYKMHTLFSFLYVYVLNQIFSSRMQIFTVHGGSRLDILQ